VLQAAVPGFSIHCKRKKKRRQYMRVIHSTRIGFDQAKKQYPKSIHATKHVCDLLLQKRQYLRVS
jgi:hypothetical protein